MAKLALAAAIAMFTSVGNVAVAGCESDLLRTAVRAIRTRRPSPLSPARLRDQRGRARGDDSGNDINGTERENDLLIGGSGEDDLDGREGSDCLAGTRRGRRSERHHPGTDGNDYIDGGNDGDAAR